MKTKLSLCLVLIMLAAGMASAATGELHILGDGTGPGPATNEIELDNTDLGTDITDTQPAGNLRNLYYDDDNNGLIEGAEIRGSGNDVATFTYSITGIQIGDTLQWLADGDDTAFADIAAGTNVGHIDDFTLKVDGTDYTVTGLTTVSPVVVGDFLVGLNVYDTGNDTVDNVAYGVSGAGDIAVQLTFSGVPTASNPTPGNTDTGVALTTNLSWEAPTAYTPLGYRVFFGTTEPNELAADYDLTELTSGIEDILTIAPVPSPLDYATTYYWVVDSYEPNTPDPNLYGGNFWSFTTQASSPSITLHPVSTTVALGDPAEFVIDVDSVSTVHYQWKQYVDGVNDVNLVVADSNTLMIASAQLTDEALYYCVVSNDSAVTDTSAMASLVTERLVSHWKLDVAAPYADTEGSNTLVPFGELGLPTNGVAGQIDEAVNFDSSADPNGQYLEAPYAVALNAASFTVSAWAKVDAGSSGYRAVVSVRDETPGTHGYILYANAANVWQLYAGNGGGAWTIVDGGAVTEDAWTMVTVTFEATGSQTSGLLTGEYSLYVNGVYVAGGAGAYNINEARGVLIGAGANNNEPRSFFFAGDIDDVRVYSEVLTPLEVATLYTTGDPTASVCLGGNPVMDIANADTGLVLGDLDFAGDCKVNLFDFAAIAGSWLDCNLIPTSLCN